MKILGITYIWYGMPDWDWITVDKPDTVIINPNSGPGQSKSNEWSDLVLRLKAAGIKVLGYVPLGYTNRQMADVLNDANNYKLWYSVDGIFWDEAPTSTSAMKYLRGVHGFARALKKPGLSVFNPGTAPQPVALYTFMISLPGSIWCTFEGSETDYYQQAPKTMFYMSRQAHIVYQASVGVAPGLVKASGVGWGFITSDGLPNPYTKWQSQWYN